jgi:enoyl-CoA hydratase
MTVSYENLIVEIQDRVATVTVQRPKVLNALNTQTLNELVAAFSDLLSRSDARAIVLTGAGEKAFIAGADISEMQSKDVAAIQAYSMLGIRLTQLMETASRPVLAAVNGFALGGGMELAMACDFIYASENAKFGQPEISLAVTPGFGGTQRLPRIVGKPRAMELLLSGDMITAQEAKEVGLVNRVFAREELLGKTREAAGKMASRGAFAISQIKRAVTYGIDMPLGAALSYENQAFSACFATADQKEGMLAFLEKRKPNFS